VVSEVQAENPSSVIDCQTDGDLKGDWDPHPLKQGVANLLINAIQHGTGDPVRLMIKSDDRFAALELHNQVRLSALRA
jgi:signal transduction histidine kinase